MEDYICCVVDQFCTNPANLEKKDRPRIRTICFSCGLTVCRKYSSLRDYYEYGRVRLCNNCQIFYDGTDLNVLKRLYKLAGY